LGLKGGCGAVAPPKRRSLGERAANFTLNERRMPNVGAFVRGKRNKAPQVKKSNSIRKCPKGGQSLW